MDENTPYPITPQPQFLYEPGFFEWASIGVLFIIVAIFIALLFKRKTNSPTKPYRILLKELASIKTANTKEASIQITLVIKHALESLLSKYDLSSLSAREIKDLLNHLSNKEIKSSLSALQEILSLLESDRLSGKNEVNVIDIKHSTKHALTELINALNKGTII
jgi:hypothetical protein